MHRIIAEKPVRLQQIADVTFSLQRRRERHAVTTALLFHRLDEHSIYFQTAGGKRGEVTQ
jgi:hypothetical protein